MKYFLFMAETTPVFSFNKLNQPAENTWMSKNYY